MAVAPRRGRRRRYSLSIHPLAIDDVVAIEAYIAQTNPDTAHAYVETVMAALLTVHQRPFSHALASTRLEAGIRQRLVGSHRIMFSVTVGVVEVFRVLHQREAMDRLMRPPRT